MSDKLEIKEIPAGTEIVHEGRFGQEMFVLIKGKVEVVIDEIPVAVIDQKGSFIGEICALLGTKRIATVRTLVDSKFYIISDLSAYFAENPESGFLMAKTLASRLIDMNKNFIQLKKALIELVGRDFIKNADKKDKESIHEAIKTIQNNLEGDVMLQAK